MALLEPPSDPGRNNMDLRVYTLILHFSIPSRDILDMYSALLNIDPVGGMIMNINYLYL